MAETLGEGHGSPDPSILAAYVVCSPVHALLFLRWRQRTDSNGLVEAPLEEAPSGGLGRCSPKQRYSLQNVDPVALRRSLVMSAEATPDCRERSWIPMTEWFTL